MSLSLRILFNKIRFNSAYYKTSSILKTTIMIAASKFIYKSCKNAVILINLD